MGILPGMRWLYSNFRKEQLKIIEVLYISLEIPQFAQNKCAEHSKIIYNVRFYTY